MRCRQSAWLRSLTEKKGVKPLSHLRSPMSRSCAGKESASSCSRWGSRQTQEGVAGLLEIEPLLPHALGQPVVLVEAEARGKGEVGTQANEHPAPVSIVDVEVILHDPTLSQLQMPSV